MFNWAFPFQMFKKALTLFNLDEGRRETCVDNTIGTIFVYECRLELESLTLTLKTITKETFITLTLKWTRCVRTSCTRSTNPLRAFINVYDENEFWYKNLRKKLGNYKKMYLIKYHKTLFIKTFIFERVLIKNNNQHGFLVQS